MSDGKSRTHSHSQSPIAATNCAARVSVPLTTLRGLLGVISTCSRTMMRSTTSRFQ
jgi:hypothetical protein